MAASTFGKLSAIVPVSCFTVGSALLALLLNSDIVKNLIFFNDSIKKSRQNYDETKKLLSNIIQDFAKAKQFSIHID